MDRKGCWRDSMFVKRLQALGHMRRPISPPAARFPTPTPASAATWLSTMQSGRTSRLAVERLTSFISNSASGSGTIIQRRSTYPNRKPVRQVASAPIHTPEADFCAASCNTAEYAKADEHHCPGIRLRNGRSRWSEKEFRNSVACETRGASAGIAFQKLTEAAIARRTIVDVKRL